MRITATRHVAGKRANQDDFGDCDIEAGAQTILQALHGVELTTAKRVRRGEVGLAADENLRLFFARRSAAELRVIWPAMMLYRP